MYQGFSSNNDDYLSEFKQKVANQKIATMEERRTELMHSRNNFLGTFAGITLAGIVGWFVLAPQYAETNKEIPIIRRPQTAIKIKPENPGGMEIPNQDRDVYNIVEKKNIDTTVVENLLPKPEKPKLPDIVPDVSEIDSGTNNLDALVGEVANTAEVADNSKVPAKPADILASAAKVQQTEKAQVATNKVNVEKKVAKVEKVEKKVAKAEPKKNNVPAKKVAQITSASKAVAGGKWQIQLIVSRNKDAVEKTWKQLSGKYALLKGYTHEIQTSNLGAQGMFYRLRAGSFSSKAEATKACATLKSQGLSDCITKER